jgi:hypothetical protein
MGEEVWASLVAYGLEGRVRDCTTMSTTKKPMLSFTTTIFRGLQDDLQATIRHLPVGTPSVLRNGLLEAHRKLSDYYYKFDQSPLYTWAARK